MFGDDKTYFAGNPVMITVSGLQFPSESSIKVCRIKVLYDGGEVGDFSGEVTGSSIEFDISSALRALWADYNTFDAELAAASAAIKSEVESTVTRNQRDYSLQVLTEYISSDGVFTTTDSGTFSGGQCVIGARTEWERSLLTSVAEADLSTLDQTNPRNGDASTKPRTSPERVGSDSITSFVDFADINPDPQKSVVQTRSTFYPSDAESASDSYQPHAPIVLRDDDVAYIDFIFVNRRGAVETCSAKMLEALDINVETKTYTLAGKSSYIPTRGLKTISSGGSRSWSMSSGYQTREWAEWWTLEFLMSSQVWMRYNNTFLPVTVVPAKKSVSIYNRTKQEMPSVEFTVTLALEG